MLEWGERVDWDGGLEMEIVLFDFVCVVVFAHTNLISLVVVVWIAGTVHTTAIISYSMAPSSLFHCSRASVGFYKIDPHLIRLVGFAP